MTNRSILDHSSHLKCSLSLEDVQLNTTCNTHTTYHLSWFNQYNWVACVNNTNNTNNTKLLITYFYHPVVTLSFLRRTAVLETHVLCDVTLF
jgi:hypothetical protein